MARLTGLFYILQALEPDIPSVIIDNLNPVTIGSILTTIGMIFVSLYRIYKERKESEEGGRTRLQEKRIETSGTIEQINMSRTDKLFAQYDVQIKRNEDQNTVLKNHVEKLQAIVSDLSAEMMKTRIENAYLMGVINNDPNWSKKINMDIIAMINGADTERVLANIKTGEEMAKNDIEEND